MLKIVLTPNRADRERYVRLMTYARDRQRKPRLLSPVGVKIKQGVRTEVAVPWGDIERLLDGAGSPLGVEPEVAAVWAAHVAAQDVVDSPRTYLPGTAVTRADLLVTGQLTEPGHGALCLMMVGP